MKSSFKTERRVAAALLGALLASASFADVFPSRVVTLVVPYPAGGVSDVIARKVNVALGKALKQTVIVENVGGAGGVIGALTDGGIPAEDAHTYAEAVRRGSVLVSVRAAETDVARVTAVMDRHNPSDLEARSAAWKSDGWTNYDPEARPYTRAETMAEQKRYG